MTPKKLVFLGVLGLKKLFRPTYSFDRIVLIFMVALCNIGQTIIFSSCDFFLLSFFLFFLA